MKIGVRAFDIRICQYQQSISSKKVYYTSHTFICVPLDELLKDFKEFLDSHPSEIVTISIGRDYSPVNLDIGTGTDIV